MKTKAYIKIYNKDFPMYRFILEEARLKETKILNDLLFSRNIKSKMSLSDTIFHFFSFFSPYEDVYDEYLIGDKNAKIKKINELLDIFLSNIDHIYLDFESYEFIMKYEVDD